MQRCDKRSGQELRPVKLKKNYIRNAGGSCLIEWGNTRVVCTATLEDKVPPFLRNSQRGWLTAEYGMLPASATSRIIREASKGKVSGRTQEIQRLIGRSLRSVLKPEALGERTIWIDCDVIQADGGTRTASISGAFVALALLNNRCVKEGIFKESVIADYVAAVSVGILDKKILLDLCYEEDSQADVDMNVVMTGSGMLIEVQGTAERAPFSVDELEAMIRAAGKGIRELVSLQKKVVVTI